MTKQLLAKMDIPNIDGYKIIGVDDDRNEFGCTVKMRKDGSFSLYRDDDGSPCFMALAAWIKIK